jgi:hypothetical protein
LQEWSFLAFVVWKCANFVVLKHFKELINFRPMRRIHVATIDHTKVAYSLEYMIKTIFVSHR